MIKRGHLILLMIYMCVSCGHKIYNVSDRIPVPDSIYKRLSTAYGTGEVPVYIANMQTDSKRLQKGVYVFRGMGPHFERRLFIYEGDWYVFRHSGSSNPLGVIEEMRSCAIKLHLTNDHIKRYNKLIATYLAEEYGVDYGADYPDKETVETIGQIQDINEKILC